MKREKVSANYVGVGFEKQEDAIKKPANTEYTESEKVKNTCTDTTLIELVCAQISKEKTQEKGCPFISGSDTKSGYSISIGIGIGIGVVDDHIGLICVSNFFHLTAAQCTYYRGFGNLTATMLTELGFHSVFHADTPF